MKKPFSFFLIFCFSIYSHADLAYVCNTGSNTVSVIDTSTNTVIDTIVNFNGPQFIAITPNNRLALVPNSNGSSVAVIDTSTNSVVQIIPTTESPPVGIAITPNGQSAYVGLFNFSTALDLISIPGFQVTSVPITGGSFTNTFGVAITGQSAYVTLSSDATVAVLNTMNNMVTTTIGVGVGPQPIVISSDGLFAYVGNNADDTVSVIDTTMNTVVTTLTLSGGFNVSMGLGVRPNANQVYVADQDSMGTGFIYTIDTLNNTLSVPHMLTPNNADVQGIAFSTDGSVLYLTVFNHNEVLAMDPDTFMVNAVIPVGNAPAGIAIIAGVAPQGPRNLQGKQLKNDSGLEYELFNLLQWHSSNTADISGYHIYRNGHLIVTVDPDTLHYQDHNRKKGVEYQYSVAAFSPFGDSTPQTITIP